jgi:hypothetical protein
MTFHPVLDWRLVTPRGVGLDAVHAALTHDAATLSYGPHTFDFTKTQEARRDVLLTLSHREDCACEREAGAGEQCPLHGRTSEQLISPVTGILDAATQRTVDDRVLQVIGGALFADVAEQVSVTEEKPRMEPSSPGASVRGAHIRRTAVRERGRVCEAPGCETLLSTYNRRHYCSVHIDGATDPHPIKHAGTSMKRDCAYCGHEFSTENPARRYCSDSCRRTMFADRRRSALGPPRE